MSEMWSHTKHNSFALERKGALSWFGKSLFAGISLASLFVLFYPFIEKATAASFPCLFKQFFGIPCPGCGYTRAIQEVQDQHWINAFYYHPLWPLFILFLATFFAIGVSALWKNKIVELPKWGILLIASLTIVAWVLKFIVGESYY